MGIFVGVKLMFVKRAIHTKNLILLVTVSLISIVLYVHFSQTLLFNRLSAWGRDNITLYVFALVLVKVFSLVYPPIPGGLVTLASIPIIGWFPAYVADFLGTILGSSISYMIGKKYGKALLYRLFDKDVIDKLLKYKIKKGKEIEAIIVLRILTGTIIVEAVCYGAGIIGVSFRANLIGTIVSHLVVGLPLYRFAALAIEGQNLLLSAVIGVVSLVILYRLKGRYFE